MKKIVLMIFGLVWIVFGYFAFQYYLYTPRLNPHPKYFITVKGDISQKVLSDMDFYVRYNYFAKNKKCDVTTSWIEGAKGTKTEKITVKLNSNYFNERKEIDRYLAGYCDWKIYAFEYFLKNKSTRKYELIKGVVFSETPSLKTDRFSDEILCDKQNGCNAGKENVFFNGEKLSRNKSCSFDLSIK